MKQIKLTPLQTDLILDSKKDFILKVFDENNLQVGDEILFIRLPELVPFAKVNATRILVKKIKELSEFDLEGEAPFVENFGKYKVYKNIEGVSINQDTEVKKVYFKIIEWL